MTDASASAVRVVLTTAPTEAIAEELVRTVVDERLAACGNVVSGVTSIYRWEGDLRREREALVVLKTTTEAVDSLEARLVALHPYEVPEVVALGVDAGHEPYLAWVLGEVDARR